MQNVTTGSPGAPPLIWGMCAIFVLFELAFQAAENGVLPIANLRWIVFEHLAYYDSDFRTMLAGAGVPNQFWFNFVTHAFLHGGIFHLVMNAVVFLSLGGMLARGLGTPRFLLLFVATAVAGALTFSLMEDFDGPLVGASGALFGFIGALKRWEWRFIQATGASSQRFWGTIIGLIAINVILFIVTPGGGSLAWQAHLGGFLAGFLLAPILAPHFASPSPI